MKKLKQNLLYVFILAIIFIVCFWIFMPELDKDPKGVFLPNRGYTESTPIPNNAVKNEKLKATDNISDNIGKIVVIVHQTTTSASQQQLCLNNLEKAVSLASEKGVAEIRYTCSDIDDKSNVRLIAYAFKGDK